MSTTLTQPKITPKHVRKLLSIVDAGLIGGAGSGPVPGQVCTEQAVCMALGLPFSDDPPCVSRALRAVKIKLNDGPWSSPAARAKGMRKLAVAQLGTIDTLDDAEFAGKLAEATIRKIVPRALRHAAKVHQQEQHRKALEEAALKCESDGTKDAAESAESAARSAAMSAESAESAARSAAWSAAMSAAMSAESAARSAAMSAARSAMSAAWSAESAKDTELTFFADMVLEILIDMKVPGIRWLKYCETP